MGCCTSSDQEVIYDKDGKDPVVDQGDKGKDTKPVVKDDKNRLKEEKAPAKGGFGNGQPFVDHDFPTSRSSLIDSRDTMGDT